VVWATQVLDDLVKEGLPSRAETTDAAMAQRAECVMLNKGPHVVEAIRFLSDVIGKMSRHQSKKTSLLGALHSWPLDAITIENRPRAAASEPNASPTTIPAPGA
jgi:pyruvate kinase